MSKIMVIKRDGRREELNLEKIHRVVFWATQDLTGVSASELELKSQLQFYNNITSSDIQETLIKAAADLISEDNPNYQFVAGRLINYHLRKQVYNQYEPIHIKQLVERNIAAGYYESDLLTWYNDSEWDQLNNAIRHDRDESLTYVAMEQLRGKYLVQNRITKQIFETPQVCYMLIAAVLFKDYPSDHRLAWVKEYYDAISNHDISLPTPVMAGVRTPQRQFSSCVLIESDDSLDSINATSAAVVKYVSQKAGIGIGGGRIRAINSAIRNGDTAHTGVIPFYKLFQAAVKSCSQGSVRGGSATLYYPIWHFEVEDLLVLKNNRGTEETRIRHLDYGVQFNKLMYERLLTGGNITLFSPHDVPEMYEAFFNDQDRFKELYETAERNTRLRKKTVRALDLFSSFMQERKDTGRIYLMNVDHANTHSPFDEKIWPVRQSNLCVAGDTRINVLVDDVEYLSINIEHLPELLDGHTVKVLSYNLDAGENQYCEIEAFAKTHPSAQLLELHDVKSEVRVRCTPDHEIYTKNRGYVVAKDLTENDQLLLSNGNIIAVRVVELEQLSEVYDITVANNANFFANGVLVHNCAEIDLPTRPLKDFHDPQARIALCTLSAVNWGNIRQPSDFERPARLAIRGLDALLDYQEYPVRAAWEATQDFRPLGVGIINFAYWLAKNDLSYTDPAALPVVDEYAEAWSYYLLKASADLAVERGACREMANTKLARGLVPCDTRKLEVDELVPHVERMPWHELRQQLQDTGIRNSTVAALMPSETSAQVANATNGIEPPRSLISVKQSKDGVLKQVVPEYRRLKNRYELLWDQPSPEGYLKICAVLQKWIDQGISVNTSYNPKFYPNEEIPLSEMLKHLVMCYKYGIKQLYYFNTNDNAGEIDVDKLLGDPAAEKSSGSGAEDDQSCESCVI